jgi:acetyl-CoA carboxylase biotin carboxyl carrier protein
MTDDVTPGPDGALPESLPEPLPDPVPEPMPLAAPAAMDLRAVDRSLLGLVDRLALLLERSELTELEVEAGETGLILRKAGALRSGASAEQGVGGAAVPVGPGPGSATTPTEIARPSVKAPLTGIFYASPAPGSANYVQVGGEVAVGQVIGLIEAMKLFNEIKSDLAGRVVRVVAESGQLVKARQPLVEVEPL